MRLYSPRHLSTSGGRRRLARLWAMPLSLGLAALAAIVVLVGGLVVLTSTGSPSPDTRRGTGTTGSPPATGSARNLVADGGFDRDVAGWRPLPGTFLTRGSAAEPAEHARVQPDPSTRAAIDPKTGRALYGMVLPVIGSAAPGTRVDATVQIRATRSQVPVLLRLSELTDGQTAARSEVRALLAGTTWHLLKVDREVRNAGATIQVEVGALALPADAAVYIDNVMVSSRP
jgi:hypothetical protein